MFPTVLEQIEYSTLFNEETVYASASGCDRALFNSPSHYEIDYSDDRRQELAKRALTIAAAGSHNLLMLYPV
jgi:predicted ATPase with chaperone activity